MVVELPVPTNLLELTWLLIGFMFGRAFGKSLDFSVQQTDWFSRQPKLSQEVVKNLLNFLHHFWIGLLLMVYAAQIGGLLRGWQVPAEVPYFAGCGLFLDDLPDVPARFKKYFAGLAAGLTTDANDDGAGTPVTVVTASGVETT